VTPAAAVVAFMFASIYLGGLWLCRHVSRGLDGHGATGPARSAGPMGRRRGAEPGAGRTVVVVVIRMGGGVRTKPGA
jgi:hypothetical protein